MLAPPVKIYYGSNEVTAALCIEALAKYSVAETGVGGVVVPVDKFGLLAPHIGLASTILAATVATVIFVKRVKRRKEKQ